MSSASLPPLRRHCAGAYTHQGRLLDKCSRCARYILFRALLDTGTMRKWHPFVTPPREGECRHFAKSRNS